MQKTLILLNKNIKIDNVNKFDNIIVSYDFGDIKKEEVSSIIYIGSCERYNTSLENNNIVLVNEAFVKKNNKDSRVLSSFSLNYYLSETAQNLNKGISIVNVLSDAKKDKTLQDEMYNKYSCLALDNYSYDVLSKALSLHKKASCLLKVSTDGIVDGNDLLDIATKSLL